MLVRTLSEGRWIRCAAKLTLPGRAALIVCGRLLSRREAVAHPS